MKAFAPFRSHPDLLDAHVAGVLWNTAVAFFGTAVFASMFQFRFPSIHAVLAKDIAISVITGLLLGYFVQRTPVRGATAVWAWVVPFLVFLIGLFMFPDAVVGLNIDQSSPSGIRKYVMFFGFTIPLIRCAAYSAGAWIALSVERTRASKL